MRHFRHSTAFAALAASAFATFAGAQTAGPPVITDAWADLSSYDGVYPSARAITAGVSGLTFTVRGTGFVFSFVTAGPPGPQSTLLWVPSSGACPVSTCEFSIYPFETGEFIVFDLPDALFAAADPGAAIRVKNPDGTLSAPHPMPVNPPMASVPLPGGYRNFPYRAFVTSGGTPPYYAWYSESPESIPGMNLAGSQQGGGLMTGTPLAVGSFSMPAAIYDVWEQTAPSEQIQFEVSELPAAFVGRPYLIRNPFVSAEPYLPSVPSGNPAFALYRSNRAGAMFTARVASGSLPPGLSLTLGSEMLSISGTPTTPGTYAAEIVISDELGMTVASGNVEMTVLQPVVILTEVLPPMPDSGTYEMALRAVSGVPPYIWTVSSGSLPAGLSLNPATGMISGETGAPPTTFTVTVTDAVGTSASRGYRLAYAIRITTDALPAGKLGENYSTFIDAAGGSGQYALRVVSGSLPPGLTLYDTRVLRGGPTKAGVYTFTVELTDRAAGLQTPVRREYTIVIEPQNLTITTPSPLPETPAGPISITFDASGGVPPYAWAAGGGLPPGTSFSSGGLLNGTANTPGSYSFTVTLTDSAKTAVSRTFALRIGPAPLTITTSTLPSGAVTEQYSAGLAATGGTPPYTWTVSGLPSGITATAGSIAGIPAAPGDFTVQLQVTDSAGVSASKTLPLAVAIRALAVQTASLSDATAGSPYSATISATGGVPPYRWTLSGTPPAGVTLSSEGALAGTPQQAGLYALNVQVTDAQGATASRSLNLRVNNRPLVITTTALPPGRAGSAYSYAVAATGGVPPFTWSGSLPAGLQIGSSTGAITGTLAAGGSLTANVAVTDSAGATTSRVYTLQVDMPAPPAVNFGSLPSTANPLAQPPFTFSLGSAYPLPVTGTVTMSFAPDSGPDDPNVVFSTGGRTTSYTIPAGSTPAVFSVPNLAFQTGTVAGVITFTLTLQSGGEDITPSPVPARQIRIAPAAPAITSVRVVPSAAGFAVEVAGYSTIREVTQAIFRLSPAPGANLQTTELTVPVSSLFGTWYGSAGSAAYGSQFLFTQNFNVQGGGNAIAGVTVTLTNSQGSSQPMSANF